MLITKYVKIHALMRPLKSSFYLFFFILTRLLSSVPYYLIGKLFNPFSFFCLYLSFPGCHRHKLMSHTGGWGQGFLDNLSLFLGPLRTDDFVKFKSKMNFQKSGHLLICLRQVPFPWEFELFTFPFGIHWGMYQSQTVPRLCQQRLSGFRFGAPGQGCEGLPHPELAYKTFSGTSKNK